MRKDKTIDEMICDFEENDQSAKMIPENEVQLDFSEVVENGYRTMRIPLRLVKIVNELIKLATPAKKRQTKTA